MWMEEKSMLCPGCGMPRDSVWPNNSQEARELHGRYQGVPIKCMACSAASEAQAKYHSQPHDEHGIHFVIKDSHLTDG